MDQHDSSETPSRAAQPAKTREITAKHLLNTATVNRWCRSWQRYHGRATIKFPIRLVRSSLQARAGKACPNKRATTDKLCAYTQCAKGAAIRCGPDSFAPLDPRSPHSRTRGL